MPLRPLQRFNGFLSRMAPNANGYGGLLSGADQRAAGRDARAILASGLLSAAGPQRMPVSLGQAIGASLPPAMAARDQRAEVGIRNEQLRREIDRENRQRQNQEKVGAFLRTAGGEQGEILGLLHDANPAGVSQILASGLMGSGETQRDPADIQIMRQLGLPMTPAGFAQLQEMKNDGETSKAIEALGLQMQTLQLANMKREQEKEDQQARETRLTRENSIKHGLEQTIKIADLTKKLEGTALAAGLPASEWRRSGVGALAAVGGALGLDVDKVNADLAAFDTFKKNLNDQLITLMSSGSLGQGTDSKLQQYRASLASPDVQPAAVMAIQANVAQTFLDQADILGIEIPDREGVEKSVEEMRNYQPYGSEALIDAPAAAAATGRAVTRAADIGRMGLQQLQQLDPATMTPELLKAAQERWEKLNAR